MERYIKIYLVLLKVNFSNLVAYRANLINALVASFVWGSFVITSMSLLTARTSSVFGWSRNELLVLSGAYNVIYSIFYFLFSENFEDFPFRVNMGELDAFLLKPINSQFLMSCRDIGFNSIMRFTIGVVFTSLLIFYNHISISLLSILGTLLMIIFSVTIIYSIWFFFMTLTIWFPNLRNLVDLLYSLNGITRYPSQIYLRVSPLLFAAFFPFTLVAIPPARTLLQKITYQEILITIITASICFVLSHIFWKFALRSYTSASS